MKTELSALDTYYIVKELGLMVDGRVDKVYQDGTKLTISAHVPGQGTRYLRVVFPNFIFLGDERGEFAHPGKLCMTLRKFLDNSRIRKVGQNGFERIVEFTFENKEGISLLIIELFSTGNIILCRSDYSIISALKFKKFSERTIRGGIAYEYPKKEFDARQMHMESFRKAIEESSKESIVKTLAIVLGLGGSYAEEICYKAGIDKSRRSLSGKELEQAYDVMKSLFVANPEPVFYSTGEIKPFPLTHLKDAEFTSYPSISAAIQHFVESIPKEKTDIERQEGSMQSRIARQQEDIKSIEQEIADNQEKGELIYSNYQKIQDILSSLQKAREKYSWKDIKEKLKGHPVVKEIDEAEDRIVIEL